MPGIASDKPLSALRAAPPVHTRRAILHMSAGLDALGQLAKLGHVADSPTQFLTVTHPPRRAFATL